MGGVIKLPGQPISTNNLYRSICVGGVPRRYMTPIGKSVKSQYRWEARQQWKQNMIPKTVPLQVNVDLYFGDRRRRDWDNYNKIVMDALEGIVFEDDSQIFKAMIAKHYSKEHPRVIVKVMKIITRKHTPVL